MKHASETRWGAALVHSAPWRGLVRSDAWKQIRSMHGWRVALNVREALRGRDLLRENRRLAGGSDALELERFQARYVIDSFVARSYEGAVLPPPELRLRVGSTTHEYEFLAKGIRSSGIVLDTFGASPEAPVLDWGCGSGRTRFWLQAYPAWREHYHGCDVDPDAVAWLRDHGVANVDVCGVTPPLPYPDQHFAGLFAFSVLTHIPAEDHAAWYREFHRVLAPGARIVFSTYGAAQAGRSPADVQDAFEREQHAWRACETPNHHYKDKCIVSPEFTQAALGGLFEVERYEEEAYAHWNDRGQDLNVARRLPG